MCFPELYWPIIHQRQYINMILHFRQSTSSKHVTHRETSLQCKQMLHMQNGGIPSLLTYCKRCSCSPTEPSCKVRTSPFLKLTLISSALNVFSTSSGNSKLLTWQDSLSYNGLQKLKSILPRHCSSVTSNIDFILQHHLYNTTKEMSFCFHPKYLQTCSQCIC